MSYISTGYWALSKTRDFTAFHCGLDTDLGLPLESSGSSRQTLGSLFQYWPITYCGLHLGTVLLPEIILSPGWS